MEARPSAKKKQAVKHKKAKSPPPKKSPAPSKVDLGSCTTDLATFCSGLGNAAYADPCDTTCATYIQCWNGGVGISSTCPSATPLFNPTKLVRMHAGRSVTIPVLNTITWITHACGFLA